MESPRDGWRGVFMSQLRHRQGDGEARSARLNSVAYGRIVLAYVLDNPLSGAIIGAKPTQVGGEPCGRV